MYVNEAISQLTIASEEVKTAYDASDAPMFDALASGVWVAFVDIDSHRLLCAFEYLVRFGYLFREDFWVSRAICSEGPHHLDRGDVVGFFRPRKYSKSERAPIVITIKDVHVR